MQTTEAYGVAIPANWNPGDDLIVSVRTMTEIIEDKEYRKVGDPRVHIANERTFLAWIRTSIGTMAIGFAVGKFALSIKQMSIMLEQLATGNTLSLSHGYSAIVGIFFVGCGTLLSLFAYVSFKKVQKQTDEDNYKSSSILDLLLLLAVLTVGIFLVIYLVNSI